MNFVYSGLSINTTNLENYIATMFKPVPIRWYTFFIRNFHYLNVLNKSFIISKILTVYLCLCHLYDLFTNFHIGKKTHAYYLKHLVLSVNIIVLQL